MITTTYKLPKTYGHRWRLAALLVCLLLAPWVLPGNAQAAPSAEEQARLTAKPFTYTDNEYLALTGPNPYDSKTLTYRKAGSKLGAGSYWANRTGGCDVYVVTDSGRYDGATGGHVQTRADEDVRKCAGSAAKQLADVNFGSVTIVNKFKKAATTPGGTPANPGGTPGTRTYALACTGGGSVTSKGPGPDKLDCTKGGHTVTVQGIGPPDDSTQTYPNTAELTLFEVTCNDGKPKDPQLGSVITGFSECKNKDALVTKVVKGKVIPPAEHPNLPLFQVTGGKTTQSGVALEKDEKVDPNDCKLEDGLCAYCYNNGCVDCSKIACTDQAVECDSDRCDLIKHYINPMIQVLSLLVGLIVAASIIWGAIQYASSEGDPQKAAQAKSRIVKTVFAFVIYLFLFGILQFLIPGGLFRRP